MPPAPKARTAAAGSDFDRSLPLKTNEPLVPQPVVQQQQQQQQPSSPQPVSRQQYNSTRGGDPGRQLFDPRLHDPLRFVSPRPAPSVAGTSSTATTAPSVVHSTFTLNSVSTGLSSIHEPSAKDKGDKERERRKRREGSERKSQRGEDDTRSRSSEGSESLKDRARGKGGCVLVDLTEAALLERMVADR
jgi:protein SMG6